MSQKIAYNDSPYMNKERYQHRTYHYQSKQKTSSGYEEEQFCIQNFFEDQKQIRFPTDIQKKYSTASELKRQSINQIQEVQKLLTENKEQSGSQSFRFRRIDNRKFLKKEKLQIVEETKVDEPNDQQINSQHQQQEENSLEINQIKQKDAEIQELNRYIKIILEEKDALTKEIGEYKPKINILNKNVEKLKADTLAKNNSISDLSQKIKEQETQLLEQKKIIDQQNLDLQIQNENILQANQEIQEKKNEIEKLKYQIQQEIELTDCLNQKNLENEQLQEQLRNLNQEKDNQNQRIQELQQQNENQSNINLEKEQIILELKNELEIKNTNLENQNKTIQELTENNDKTYQEIQKLNSEMKKKQNKITELQVELDVLKYGEDRITLNVKSFSTNVSQTLKVKLKDSISDLYIMAVQQGIHKGSPQDCCLLVPSKNKKYNSSEWITKFYEIFIPSEYRDQIITIEFSQFR